MLVKKLFRRILGFFRKKEHGFKWQIVFELPEEPLEKILYLEGNIREKDYWYALLRCPCGCGDKIMLNLMNDAKPCWKVNIDKRRPSVFPSIWRTKNYKSHFWLSKGKVVWA
ncbi:DUF6527 family protein [Ulvibacterium marinum]|uniref:Uncharacterized protein n=1 Tax=Ulvibacterium marinum TaxID=2419782 RepID=A0A3B0CAD2_9FLAO|nr:DUF6527 family protein [Ulvibacterium marinum]RKN82852.1 hypothetical protein D7Z94_03155 [Ulvibacterium marinum]